MIILPEFVCTVLFYAKPANDLGRQIRIQMYVFPSRCFQDITVERDSPQYITFVITFNNTISGS